MINTIEKREKKETIKDMTKDRLYSFLFDFLFIKNKKYISYKDIPVKLLNDDYLTYEGNIVMNVMRELDFNKMKYNKAYNDKKENGNMSIYIPTTKTHEKLINFMTDKGTTSRDLLNMLFN